MAGVARLVLGSGAVPEIVRDLTDDPLTLGRAPDAGFVLHDARVSRYHARIERRQDGYLLIDLGSANGVRVNGERIERERRLADGDAILLGDSLLHFLLVPFEQRTPSPASDAAERHSQVQIPLRNRDAESAPVGPRFIRPSSPAAAPPAFPNYTQIEQRLPIWVWHVIRGVVLLGALVIAILLFVRPSAGITLFWKLVIPLLPALFFIAPGIWRNTCPLATMNQTPRLLGFTRGLTPPEVFKQYAYIIGIVLFLIAIPTRIALFNQNAAASGLLLLAALASGFIGGLVFKGKSGWCSSICPLLPVQRVYGQTPYIMSPNSHCQPCVGCAKNCYDFNPRVAYLADLNDDDPQYVQYRTFFAGALPGVILAFYTVPKPPASSIPEVYLRFALYILASVGSFYLIRAFSRLSTHTITALYAMAALNLFYWWATPILLTTILSPVSVTPPTWLSWPFQLALLGLSVLWIARTVEKEPRFLARAAGESTLHAVGQGAKALQRAASANRPEVRIEPDGRRVAVDRNRTLLEIIEGQGLRIESGCRMGVCGSDPIAILDGAENLTPASEEERAAIERLNLGEQARMACCARVLGNCSISLAPGKATTSEPASTIVQPLRVNPGVGRVVIVGNGIAGVTAVDFLRRRHPTCDIQLIARENHHLYNRIGIERLIYGRSAMQGLYLQPETWYDDHKITTWLNTRAVRIDRTAQQVLLGTGETLPYDRLILATGSASSVPTLAGFGVAGTFVLREAEDAMQIRAFAQETEAREAVVMGAGLLGLEAAHALRRLGLRVAVLERSDSLLRRQIDARCAQFLREYLEGLGIEIVVQAETTAVEGNGRVTGVALRDGRRIPCQLFLVCAGITPNADLARDAGLAVNHGVVVDSAMRTSDPLIFAAGDVAEHQNQVLGLWPIAVAQAKIAALNAVGGSRVYEGIVPVAILKVAGIDLMSIGQIAAASDAESEIVLEDAGMHAYRKLVIAGGRIVGAILCGYPLEAPLVRSAIDQKLDVRSVLGELRAGDWSVLADLPAKDSAHTPLPAN